MSKDKANILLPVDYADWISSLKKRIAGARQRIVLSANEEQIRLYHDIGRDILDRQNRQECPDIKIGQQPADQLPWFHIVTLITKITDSTLRGWYARETVKQAWSRDTLVMHIRTDDKPTIGLLLCKTRKRLVAEYALSGIDKPIGVAEYQLVRALPEPLDTSLPSVEEIEAELSGGGDG